MVVFIVILLVSAVSGCRSVASYGRSRATDFADIWTLEGSLGPGLDVHAHVTEEYGTVLGLSKQWGLGFHNGVSAWTERASGGLLLMGGQNLEVKPMSEVYVPEANIGWLLFKRFEHPIGPHLGRNERPWPGKYDVEAGGSLIAVGLHGGFSPVELGDFFAGLFGHDFMCDDYYPYLPDGEYISMTEAASRGNLKMVRTMLNHGWDPNRSDPEMRDNTRPLSAAVHQGNTDMTRLLLDHDATMAHPLHGAASADSSELISLFLQRGWDVRDRQRNRDTPLHIAARKSSTEAARTLLENGAPVDARNNKDETPLYLCALHNNPAMARLLIDHGANLDGAGQKRPLIRAVSRSHVEMAKLLIKNGARVGARDAQGNTPLHVAARTRSVAIVNLLLNNGSSINKRNHRRHTPLHRACSRLYPPIIKRLLDAGADPMARTADGITALHFAGGPTDRYEGQNFYPESDWQAKTTRLLIKHGAKVRARDENGLTPLHFAGRGRRMGVIKVLIEHGVDVNAHDKKGRTPLDLTWDSDVKKLLRKHGAKSSQR